MLFDFISVCIQLITFSVAFDVASQVSAGHPFSSHLFPVHQILLFLFADQKTTDPQHPHHSVSPFSYFHQIHIVHSSFLESIYYVSLLHPELHQVRHQNRLLWLRYFHLVVLHN